MSTGDIFLGLLAILFPPIAVWIKRGICSVDSLINILLSVVGYLPGVVHAWYIIAKFPDDDLGNYEALPQHQPPGGVTYYYVSHEGRSQGGSGGPTAVTGAPDGGRAQREAQRGPTTYGTLPSAVPAPQPHSEGGPAAGPAERATPPTYAEAVKGDHKVQSP